MRNRSKRKSVDYPSSDQSTRITFDIPKFSPDTSRRNLQQPFFSLRNAARRRFCLHEALTSMALWPRQVDSKSDVCLALLAGMESVVGIVQCVSMCQFKFWIQGVPNRRFQSRPLDGFDIGETRHPPCFSAADQLSFVIHCSLCS